MSSRARRFLSWAPPPAHAPSIWRGSSTTPAARSTPVRGSCRRRRSMTPGLLRALPRQGRILGGVAMLAGVIPLKSAEDVREWLNAGHGLGCPRASSRSSVKPAGRRRGCRYLRLRDGVYRRRRSRASTAGRAARLEAGACAGDDDFLLAGDGRGSIAAVLRICGGAGQQGSLR